MLVTSFLDWKFCLKETSRVKHRRQAFLLSLRRRRALGNAGDSGNVGTLNQLVLFTPNSNFALTLLSQLLGLQD